MLSIFKNTLNNFILKKLVSSNLYLLYLYQDKIEENKEIDKIDKNKFNQENNDGLKYQSKQEESSSSKDKKKMDNFLFNFSLNEPKKSLSQTISLSTTSLSSTSSSNNEIAKCLINYSNDKPVF
ncbi:hypothetical protein RhiirC2_778385 [Rhizophagus irregularis]|uniref:Uncharacterized protein n=1 Tax=Rhizophagus irregularis TaxID=588596 RepID=A0A2N1NC89_9GLOM|nr:hypothetical protein RhiirC2_778385 [Rhizophagus irregularis]